RAACVLGVVFEARALEVLDHVGLAVGSAFLLERLREGITEVLDAVVRLPVRAYRARYAVTGLWEECAPGGRLRRCDSRVALAACLAVHCVGSQARQLDQERKLGVLVELVPVGKLALVLRVVLEAGPLEVLHPVIALFALLGYRVAEN